MASYDEIGKVMSRNNPVAGTNRPADAYRQWLIAKGANATSGKSIRALEMSFFAANGGSGKTYTELMGTFCAAKGYSGGRSVLDNWRRFLNGGTV